MPGRMLTPGGFFLTTGVLQHDVEYQTGAVPGAHAPYDGDGEHGAYRQRRRGDW